MHLSMTHIAVVTTQVFHILLSLADTPRHGYGIIKDIDQHTSGRFRLGTGLVYTALQRLLDAGWIESTDERAPAHEDDERRQYYRLTALGRQMLRAEVEHLDQAVGLARRRRVLSRRAHGPQRS
jgi:DNA-binding PadR family transcriptional regulator